jgi:hypothetical protein
MGESRGAYRVLVGNAEGRRPLERHRRRWDDNVKTNLRELGGKHGLDRSGSVYGQVAGFFECGKEPSGSIKCGEFLEQLRTC